MAREIQQRFPNLVTEVVNLDKSGSTKPGNVIAVPTYLLDERVFSLGNPGREEMFARLSLALSRKTTAGER